MQKDTLTNTVKSLRSALKKLAPVLASEFKSGDKQEPLYGAALTFASNAFTPDLTQAYQQGQTGIYYGEGRFVIGKEIGAAITRPEMEKCCVPASQLDSDNAVKELSGKRVTSIMRNVVYQAHATFPDKTT